MRSRLSRSFIAYHISFTNLLTPLIHTFYFLTYSSFHSYRLHFSPLSHTLHTYLQWSPLHTTDILFSNSTTLFNTLKSILATAHSHFHSRILHCRTYSTPLHSHIPLSHTAPSHTLYSTQLANTTSSHTFYTTVAHILHHYRTHSTPLSHTLLSTRTYSNPYAHIVIYTDRLYSTLIHSKPHSQTLNSTLAILSHTCYTLAHAILSHTLHRESERREAMSSSRRRRTRRKKKRKELQKNRKRMFDLFLLN